RLRGRVSLPRVCPGLCTMPDLSGSECGQGTLRSGPCLHFLVTSPTSRSPLPFCSGCSAPAPSSLHKPFPIEKETGYELAQQEEPLDIPQSEEAEREIIGNRSRRSWCLHAVTCTGKAPARGSPGLINQLDGHGDTPQGWASSEVANLSRICEKSYKHDSVNELVFSQHNQVSVQKEFPCSVPREDILICFSHEKPLTASIRAPPIPTKTINTYIKLWADTQRELDTMLQREREEFLQPQEDREKVKKMLATAYVQYLEMLRRLEAAHDHLIHQQKRAAVRHVLDGVMGRVLEIKREMVALESCECHCMDGILMDLGRVPEDIEIPIPKYFIKENLRILQEREQYLHEILLNAGLLEQEPVMAMTLEEGIKVIQVAERARQGRARAAFMRRIYLEEKRQSQKQEKGTDKNPDDAATCIQKVWRGYRQRMETEKLREEEMIFLGMSLPPDVEARISLQKADVLQGEVQEREDFSFRQELREAEGSHIKETLQDQITQCFVECRHITGRFPDYPPEKTGGSKAIFIEKHPEQEAVKKEKNGKDKEAKLQKAQKAGKQEGSSQYQVFWENRDNRSDFLQDHDPELIKREEREEVEEEIRVQVDEVMQEKLLKVKQAVDGETGPHGKKAGKGDKELAEEGLLIQVKNVNLSDYIGYYDCLSNILRGTGAQPVPSIPEVRQLVALYGILPLGSQTVHENAPLVKSLLLAGPAGVGKKMLVHAICTETGANLFNLTPSNIAGKYPGRDALIMMLHMILKVGKELQPSVVWIGDTERMFSKGAPKGEDEVNSKRLAKLLPQFLRAVKAKDRVLLVGTSSRPFDANLGPFCKHYILQSGGTLTKQLNLNCLAQVSDGFTQGHVVDVVHTVLTELRLLQMARKPLRTAEFVTSLARHDPVYREEEETFQVSLLSCSLNPPAPPSTNRMLILTAFSKASSTAVLMIVQISPSPAATARERQFLLEPKLTITTLSLSWEGPEAAAHPSSAVLSETGINCSVQQPAGRLTPVSQLLAVFICRVPVIISPSWGPEAALEKMTPKRIFWGQERNMLSVPSPYLFSQLLFLLKLEAGFGMDQMGKADFAGCHVEGEPRAASLTSQPRSWASLQSNSTRIIYKSQACEQASESNKQVLNVRGLFCFLSSLMEIKAVCIDLWRHEKGMICLLPSLVCQNPTGESMEHSTGSKGSRKRKEERKERKEREKNSCVNLTTGDWKYRAHHPQGAEEAPCACTSSLGGTSWAALLQEAAGKGMRKPNGKRHSWEQECLRKNGLGGFLGVTNCTENYWSNCTQWRELDGSGLPMISPFQPGGCTSSPAKEIQAVREEMLVTSPLCTPSGHQPVSDGHQPFPKP
ncbi:IQ and AAA domain-containing protein 1-like, partial [Lamprotornis superbus]